MAAFPRALYNYDGDLCHFAGKSKLMSILENSLPDQRPDQEEEQHRHAGRSVVIIDGMAVVQALGKPTWVCNGRDLTSHFLELINSRSKECNEVHFVFDLHDIPNSLKQGIASFAEVATGPWCTKSLMMQSSK